jgi:hypothetical protein
VYASLVHQQQERKQQEVKLGVVGDDAGDPGGVEDPTGQQEVA